MQEVREVITPFASLGVKGVRANTLVHDAVAEVSDLTSKTTYRLIVLFLLSPSRLSANFRYATAL